MRHSHVHLRSSIFSPRHTQLIRTIPTVQRCSCDVEDFLVADPLDECRIVRDLVVKVTSHSAHQSRSKPPASQGAELVFLISMSAVSNPIYNCLSVRVCWYVYWPHVMYSWAGMTQSATTLCCAIELEPASNYIPTLLISQLVRSLLNQTSKHCTRRIPRFGPGFGSERLGVGSRGSQEPESLLKLR